MLRRHLRFLPWTAPQRGAPPHTSNIPGIRASPHGGLVTGLAEPKSPELLQVQSSGFEVQGSRFKVQGSEPSEVSGKEAMT